MKYKSFLDCVDLVGLACQPFGGVKKYISTGAVDTDHINEDDVEIIEFNERPSRANLQVKPGDIIFAKMQATKKILTIDEDLSKNVYSTGFCAVNAKNGILKNRCLYHLLTSDAFLDQKDKNCSGATQKAITKPGLEKVIIHIPDYSVQDVISKQLDLASSMIQKRKLEIQSLDNLIKARFVEMFGESSFPCVALIDLIAEGAGLSYGIVQPGEDGTGEMGVIRPVDMVDGKISTASIKYIDRTIGDGFRKTELTGDELLITVRGTTGITALTDARFAGMNVTRGIAVIRFDRSKVNPVYLNAFLNSDESQRYIQEHTRGATLQQINLSDLRVQQILLPPRKVQDAFATFAQQIDKSKVVVQKALNEAQLLFDSLMQQYFG